MKQAENMSHAEACAWLDKVLKHNTKMPQWRVEIGYCGEVAGMFGTLSTCAGRVAEGKRAGMDLSAEGWPRWVATVAAVYAVKNPFPKTWGRIPDPCAELKKALDTLARLDDTADGDAKRAEARRMEVAWARMHGAAEVRAKWLLDRERMKAEEEVRIEKERAERASTAEERDAARKALADAERKAANLDKMNGNLQWLVDNEKEKKRRRSKTAKANPRRGVDDQMEGRWDGFLRGLDKKLEADKRKPPKQRQGQQAVIEDAIQKHNEASENQITIGWQAVKKRLQRGKKRPAR